MHIKKRKYPEDSLSCKWIYGRRSAAVLVLLLFGLFFSLTSRAQSIQVIPNPDGTTGGFQGESVVYNGNLYIKYTNTAGHTQLAELTGNTLTLIPNPNAGDVNIFDGNASNPFVVYNGNLYFQYENTNGHLNLAKYNGTTVSIIANPLPGVGDVGEPDPNFVLFNNKIYFQYYSTVAGKSKYQLAQYNGTSISIVANPDLGLDPDGYLANPIIYNNMLYLDYVNASGIGQLAQYNGTSITLIPNPDSGAGYEGIDGSGTNAPIIYNNKLYFNYMNVAGISQMAQYDGTTLSLVPNPDATTIGTYFDQKPSIFNNDLYFDYIDVSGNFKFAQYNGTTISLLPYPPGSGQHSVTYPYPWTTFGDSLMTQFYDPFGYLQLAEYDGLTSTLLALPAGAVSYGGQGIVYNHQFYGSYNTTSGVFQLGQYDGTDGVSLLPNANPADIGYAGYPILFNNRLYFMYQDASFAYELAYIEDCPKLVITADDTIICPGTTANFVLTTATDVGKNPTYQWSVNNTIAQNGGISFGTSTLNNRDTVICTLTNKTSACTTSAPADSIIMTVYPEPTASIAGDTCQNSVLTATTGNATDTITWYRNGVTIIHQAASDSTTHTATIPGNYTATATSLKGCISQFSDTIVVKAPLVPLVIIASNKNGICKGVNISFAASPTNGGANPIYQWKLNGVNVGADTSVYANTHFNNGDVVSCWMTSSIACVTTPTVISDSVQLVVNDSPAVAVSIMADNDPVCFGTPVNFSATPVNGGTIPAYQWILNGNIVGTNGTTYTNDTLVNGDTINCVLISSLGCTIPVESSTITMTVYPLPTVGAVPDTTVAINSLVLLNLPIMGTIASYAWTPVATLTNATIANPTAVPKVNTTYHLIVTSDHGCTASGDITVDLFSALNMPDAFTPNGDNLNDVFRIPPSVRIHIDFFAVFDRWGNEVFRTTDPSVGWDGRYNGIPTAEATYAWVIQYTDPFSNQTVADKGTVVLIR